MDKPDEKGPAGGAARNASPTAVGPARELDCRGMNCPMPVLKTKKAIVELKPGELLKVTATDPGSVADMAAFSRRTGHALVDQGQVDGAYFFVFRRA